MNRPTIRPTCRKVFYEPFKTKYNDIVPSGPQHMKLQWTKGNEQCRLEVDLSTARHVVHHQDVDGKTAALRF